MLNEEFDIIEIEKIEAENTPVDELDTDNTNLICVNVDESGSMSQYVNTMKESFDRFKSALSNSKEADEILVAKSTFNSHISIGGYESIDKFDISYNPGGGTRLYDVIVAGTEKLLNYLKYLDSKGMRTKTVFSVFSDGKDYGSTAAVSEAKKKIEELNEKEIITAFICFGQNAQDEAARLGFKNILNIDSTDDTKVAESKIRNAFDCLSKSVIDNSKSVISKTNDFFTV